MDIPFYARVLVAVFGSLFVRERKLPKVMNSSRIEVDWSNFGSHL